MAQLVRLTSRKAPKVSWWCKMLGLDGSPRKEHGGTHKTPEENFARMKLRGYAYKVDVDGRWWKRETRHDIATGLVLTQTRRVTD